ncbi:MAG: conjugal transfer protein TraF, partial [Pseudomonadota bacterium]|nr:conjugal transfer protein TraF [Pseudomonadota bacterium]
RRGRVVVHGWLALAATVLVAPASAETGGRVVVETRVTDEAAYFGRHAEGWFWYRDPKSAEEPTAPEPPVPSIDPVEQIKAQRQQLEIAVSRAILSPTRDNMRRYLQLNQQLMAQAGRFAEAWRGLVWSEPALDYSLVSPVGASAYLKADSDAASDEAQLAAAARRWGLLFFFRGSCPYCHRLAPLLRRFAEHYGFDIVGVSLDGGTLPEFPQPRRNDRAAESLGVQAVPALYLADPQTRRIVPAAFGLVGWSELVRRVVYALDQAGSSSAGPAQDLSLGDSP